MITEKSKNMKNRLLLRTKSILRLPPRERKRQRRLRIQMLPKDLLPHSCSSLIGEDPRSCKKIPVSFLSISHSNFIGIKITEISVQIGQEWKQMSEEQQKVSLLSIKFLFNFDFG